jgi:hypothetical protein
MKENQEAFEKSDALNMGQILSIPFIWSTDNSVETKTDRSLIVEKNHSLSLKLSKKTWIKIS